MNRSTKENPKVRLINSILFYAYLLLISILSLLPSDSMPDIPLFPNADKLIHMAMYAGFTFLLLNAWKGYFIDRNKWLIPVLIALWGIGMESLQSLKSIGRSFDLWDEAANIAGFFPGWLAVVVFQKYKKRFRSKNQNQQTSEV